MRGQFKLTTRIKNYLQGPRVPQRISTLFSRLKLSAPEAPRPNSIPGLRVEGADSILKPEITEISVEQKIAETEQAVNAAPKLEQKPTKPSGKRITIGTIAAGSLAALAITLIPKLAYAGTLGTTLVALASNPVGIAALAGIGITAAAFYVKYLFGFDKTMGERNANPGDPSFWKQIATFSVIPLSIMTGSGLIYLGACFLPWGATPTFFALAGMGILVGAYKTFASIKKSIKASKQTITPGFKANKRQIIETPVLSHLVQGAEAAYMFYRGATFFELVIGVASYIAHNSIATVSLASLGTGALAGLAIGFPLLSIYLRFTSKKWNELQHNHGPRFDFKSEKYKVLLTLLGSAVAGALLWNFSPILINLALGFAFFFTEVHALVHNWSCQGGSREIIQTPPEEYSDATVWNAARRPKSPHITVMKPGFFPEDFLIPTYALLYLRKGVNWDFNIISGINTGMAFAFKDTHETLHFLRRKQEAILKIIAVYSGRIYSASTLRDKYIQLAKLYEALAKHWENESSGNFKKLTVTPYKGKRNIFIDENANDFEKYLGKIMRWEADKFRAEARNLSSRAAEARSQEEIDERLEAFERQYSLIFHWFPPKRFRNICPDVIKSKIREIDLFNHLTKAFKTGAAILRRNRSTHEFYWEILPCKRIRRLNTKTNTLSWENRTVAELDETESYSDIAYVDNSGMRDPAGPVHSREAYTYGPATDGEFMSVVYKDGRSESFIMQGGRVITSDNGIAKNPNSDEVVWVPGMPINPALEALLPKEWKDKNGRIHDVFNPDLFHFFESRYQTMCDGEHADIITSDFLAPLEKDIKDPYLFSLWKVPEEIAVPNPEELKENKEDELRRISASYANFCIRVTEAASGKEFYIPYNWMKNTQIKGEIWTNIHHIKLMSRKEFERRFNVDPRDNHGDKLPYVIVPYDGNNIRLKPNLKDKDFKGIGPDFNQIWNDLKNQGYVNEDGVIQPKFDGIRSNFRLSINVSEKELDEIFKVLLQMYRTVLPYSYFLKEPSAYSSAEFDRGLGRIGDMNFVAYTFERSDGTRYMRWLPKKEDWPEMDFDERHQSFVSKGKKVILKTCRWIGKRFYFDKHRLGIDPGSHENPNFEVLQIEGPEEFLRNIGIDPEYERSPELLDPSRRVIKNRFVMARQTRRIDGTLGKEYSTFEYSGKNLDSVVDQQRIDENNLELVRITQADKQVVELGNYQRLRYDSTWISSATINDHHEKVRVTIHFVNPYTGDELEPQHIDLDKDLFPNIDAIYRSGNNQAYLPKIFDQRQKDKKTGDIENRLFLTFYTCKTEPVQHGINLAPGEEAKLIEVKSSLKIMHANNINGVEDSEEWIPFDHEMPKAAKSEIYFNPDNKPFSSGLSFGHVDTMVAPQHLIPVRRVKGGLWDDLVRAPLLGRGAAGPEWATDDQKFYFGEAEGEYNYYDGWIEERAMPKLGSTGPFSLQYAKSVRGAALNTGSNTVMRAPHEDLLFPREDLEVYAVWNGRNYMPAPLYRSLDEKATTTEDAQGAREKKIKLDLDTRNDRTVRSAGASVNNVGEGNGQRGRWAAMLLFLQRILKMFYDEIYRARIKKEIPPQYSNEQLHEWFNTFTWYMDTLFKHIVPLIPFVYMLGLSPLPAGAVVFPLLWFIKTATGWPKYSSDNQKVGVSRIRSYFRNLALYYLYIPNISRNTSHIVDEAKGPFVSTAGIGGKTFYPWAIRRIVLYFGGLSGITTAIGIYRMIAFGMASLGYFGLMMNVIWPAFMFIGVAYALRMVWNGIKLDKNISSFNIFQAAGQAFWNCRIEPFKRWWPSFKQRMDLLTQEFLKPIFVDWFTELSKSSQRAYRYFRYGEV